MRAISSIVSSDDIEDIVQEAFIKSYEAELKQEIRYERTYMLRTVKNLALNHVNQAASQRNENPDNMDALPHELVGHSLEKHVESKERFLHFCKATDTLSPEVKKVFLLKKVYGMSQKDIAELTGLSQSTVEKHVAKGVLQCAAFLKQVGKEQAEGTAGSVTSQDKVSSKP